MTFTATLSSRFQISILKSVRTSHGWKAGQEFVFITEGSGVLLVPELRREDLGGFVRGAQAEDFRDREDRF